MFLKIIAFLCIANIAHAGKCVAQKKAQQPSKLATPKESKKDTLLPIPSKVDTIIYIDPKTGKPRALGKKADTPKTPLRKPDKIIYIDNGKERLPATTPQTAPQRIDTVIVLKKGKQTKELLKPDSKKDTIKIQQIPESCKCMTFAIKAPDTLRIDDYVNYSFILKNNCKERLWVNTAGFTFFVFNPDGTPVRVLRKLQYVKQFKYPDFVQLSPGEEYVFDFADDPFFQYDLRPYWQYRFTFAYINTTNKYKSAPKQTYLCREFKDKTIAIANRPRLRK